MKDSREVILQRIRSGLTNAVAAGFGDIRQPPVHEVWPRTTPAPLSMVEQFSDELKSLHGEPIHCPTMADARRTLAELMEAAPWANMGALDSPLTRELTAELPPERVAWVTADWTALQIEKLPVGLIAADALLADTGSCVVTCTSSQERLMCYLPPACIVVARIEQMAEHLPAAWSPISKTCTSPDSRGEVVLITGPSRTADIEKKLILGVHGPKRLVVIVVG